MSDEKPDGDGEDVAMAMVTANVPESLKDAAKAELPHGGLTEAIRDRLTEIAYGGDIGERSRLERQRERLDEEVRDLRAQRRDIDSQIETVEEKRAAVDKKVSNLTTREDKFDAKIEELESMLRLDGIRVNPNMPAVKRAADTGGVKTAAVIKTLKERNPDVPGFAFKDGLHDHENEWHGVPESLRDTPPDEREATYR